MAKKKLNSKKPINPLAVVAMVTAVVLVVISGAMWWAYSFSTSMVKEELSSQKIFFPPAGSPALSAEEYPGLQQYAGQQVDDGVKAKAYANEFIGHHLEKIAGGKTYAEVSSESMKNPADEKLAGQKQQLFMGETLRGLLLNAYAWWTIGKLLQVVSVVALVAGLLLGLAAVLGLTKSRS